MTRERTQHIMELVDEFADGILRQFASSTAEERNKHARRYIRAFKTLVEEYGDAGREALTLLLRHEDQDVRRVAAAFLRRYAHEESMAVLREQASGVGMAAFAAQCSIKNWEEGVWELDPE